MMAASMRSEENLNFYRYSTLLLDKGGDAFRLVIRRFCTKENIDFKEFLSTYKKDLFGCKKQSGKSAGAIWDGEWRKMYECESDTDSDQWENWTVKDHVTLDCLEINLLSDIVCSVCPLLTFYLNMHRAHYGNPTFETFLNTKKHDLFHNFEKGPDEGKCCCCPATPLARTSCGAPLSENQWNRLFKETRKCEVCRSSSSSHCCNMYKARPNLIDKCSLSILAKVLHFTVPIFRHLDKLITKRHRVYAHPMNDSKMDNDTFSKEWDELADCILEIADINDHENIEIWRNEIDLLKIPIPTDEEYHSVLELVETMRRTDNDILKILDVISSGQEKILKAVTKERKENMELTKVRISQHEKGLRVATEATLEAERLLHSGPIVIFTGISGQGKTWHCLEILSEMITTHDIVQIDNARLDFKEWERLVDTESDLVVWIDDLQASSVQKALFERIQTVLSSEGSKMKIVCSIKTPEMEQLKSLHLDLFQEKYHVNLDDEQDGFKCAEHRQNILMGFLSLGHQNVSSSSLRDYLHITVVDSREEENLLSEPYRISETTIKLISRICTSIGFPECCRRFCSDPSLFAMGERFFKNPDKSTLDLLKSMANNDERIQRLQFLFLSKLMLESQPKELNILVENIPDYLRDMLDIEEIPRGHIGWRRVMRQLIPSFVKEVDDKILFQHDTIRTAVAMVFCDLDESSLYRFVQEGPIDLVLDLCRTEYHQASHGQNRFSIRSEEYFKRIVHELTHNSYRSSVKQVLWALGSLDSDIWLRFLESLENFGADVKLQVRRAIARDFDLYAFHTARHTDLNKQIIHDADSKVGVIAYLFLFPFPEIQSDQNVNSGSVSISRHLRNMLVHSSMSTEFYHLGFLSLFVNAVSMYKDYIVDAALKLILQFQSFGMYILFDFQTGRESVASLDQEERHILLKWALDFYIEGNLSKNYILKIVFHIMKSHGYADATVNDFFGKLRIPAAVTNTEFQPTTESDQFWCQIEKFADQKFVEVLVLFQSIVKGDPSILEEILNRASLLTDNSYSLSSVKRVNFSEEGFNVWLFLSECSDLKLCQSFGLTYLRAKQLLFDRFLQEYLSFYICFLARSQLLFDTGTEQPCNKCSRNDSSNPRMDSCLFIWENVGDISHFLELSNTIEIKNPVYYYTYCTHHLSDLLLLNVKMENSLNFQCAVEQIHKNRMEVLGFLINKLKDDKNSDASKLFEEACIVGSYLCVRYILDEFMVIDKAIVTTGLFLACKNGHSLVANTILSWKPDVVTIDELTESLRLAVKQKHDQVCAYLLTSQQMISFLSNGSRHRNESSLKVVEEALAILNKKYLSVVMSTFKDKNIRGNADRVST